MLLVGNLVACLTFVYFYARHFLPWVERRPESVHYTDPVLGWIRPRDCSLVNTLLLYSSVAATAWDHACSLESAVMWLQVHTLIFFCRMFCLYMLPLAPPAGYVPMRDPLVDWLTGADAEPLSRDLAMSGHVAFVTANFMMATSPGALFVHCYCMAMVPVFLLVQHVHYTFDLFVAYFVATLCAAAAHPVALARLTAANPFAP